MTKTSLAPAEVQSVREQFPYFADLPHLNGHPVAYLDSAATAQRPKSVIDAEVEFVTRHNAAVHRGTSNAVGEATLNFEDARERVATLVGAGSSHTVVWTTGATDALNQIAISFSEATAGVESPSLSVPGSENWAIQPGDEILVTEAEHHANLIPWQRLAARTGASLKYIPVNEYGVWGLDEAREALSERTRLFAFAHVSNVTGAVAPVSELVELAQRTGHGRTITVMDACQSVPHIPVDVQELGVDFAVFSGHKMCGPNGIGALIGRTELLNQLPPARTGGSAITVVDMDHAEFLDAPHRFEPGTQPVSQVIGVGAAAEFLHGVGMDRLEATEHDLVTQLWDGLAAIDGIKVLGPQNARDRVAMAAVTIPGLHSHDIGQVLDSQGVFVRTGHHCAQPLHRKLGIASSVRASIHLYSTADEVDRFIAGIREAKQYFGV